MKNKNIVKCRLFMFLLGVAIFLPNTMWAQDVEMANTWQCYDLLDEQTKKALLIYEDFFASLFQFPNKYETASESEKKSFIIRWVKQLRDNDREKNTMAAAYLGMVKASNATGPLERRAAGGGANRIRWICARSLGQIGNKSSIPVLIGLLDNRNSNIRVYARVALAEITGVYLGDDKESWKQYQTGKMPAPYSVKERKIDKTESKSSAIRRSFSRDKLDFHLPDIYGRIVDSQDYANTPVLIMSGSCWCGGCQQDAEPLRKIADKYAPRGLQTIRTVAGDNELAGLDFQKHYRLGFVQLLDTNRSFEKRYNTDGWTFLMLADREGKIVYRVNGPHEKDWQQLKNILDDMFAGGAANKTVMQDGTAYMPATLQRTGEAETQRICDRFPSIACGSDGKAYVSFTTNRNGNSDVFLRVFDGAKWSEDMPIAATAADEYDSTVVVDNKGKVWISWTSNAKSRSYDIYVTSFTKPTEPGVPVKLTHSDDGAMHPRMVCDEKGRMWVTYYKWHKMGQYSRDKETYLRRLENGEWSQEIQISPTDVPRYEDHSDPAITAYGSSVIVAWSWDFHPPNKGYSNNAKHPTIFMRPVTGKMNLGEISCVSGNNIDVMPSLIATKNKRIWCAWDSLGRSQRKSLCVSNVYPGRDNPVNKIQSLTKPVVNVCSPCFTESPAGRLTLLWSETENGSQWVLKRADLDADSRWPGSTTVESAGNPRFCSAAYDLQGQLWITYSAQTKQDRQIVVKNLGKSKPGVHTKSVNGPASSNTKAINKLRQAIDEKYSYRDFRGIDWNKMFDKYEPRMQRAKTPTEFAEAAARMLLNAKDMHLWVKVDGKTIGNFRRKTKGNYRIDFLSKNVAGWRDLSKYVSMGRIGDDIGYILIKGWRKDRQQVLEPALKALRELSDLPALVIDVRPNSGGAEPLAREFAGCFIDEPAVYAKHVYRKTDTAEGWGQIHNRMLEPTKNQPQYRGKIAVLMGRANMSSCEAFLLMMKQIPNCKLIGDKSYGSSGNPKPHDLGNGVTIWLPSWKALRADGSCFEGQGIKPDIGVRTNERLLKEKDPVLEKALRYLRSDR